MVNEIVHACKRHQNRIKELLHGQIQSYQLHCNESSTYKQSCLFICPKDGPFKDKLTRVQSWKPFQLSTWIYSCNILPNKTMSSLYDMILLRIIYRRIHLGVRQIIAVSKFQLFQSVQCQKIHSRHEFLNSVKLLKKHRTKCFGN